LLDCHLCGQSHHYYVPCPRPGPAEIHPHPASMTRFLRGQVPPPSSITITCSEVRRFSLPKCFPVSFAHVVQRSGVA
jgi:hypothetical protein